MKPNFGEAARSRSPGGRTPIPDSTRSPETRVHDIGKLTLGQKRTALSSQEPTGWTHREATSPIAGTHAVEIIPLARHSQNQSGDPFPGEHLAIGLEKLALSDSILALSSTGLGGTIDPEGDSLLSYQIARKNKPLQKSRYSVSESIMACGDLKNHQVQPDIEPGDSNPQAAYGSDGNSNLPGSGQDESSTAPRDQPALSPSSQGFDLERDSEMDMNPILLLQPETRPISHNQLVVEVKGIYAGLGMVERKCVDVDEKQLKEALEKD